MAFDLDGLAVLAGMAARPDAFAGVETEAAKIARTLLTKLLKDKATTLSALRAMASALPEGTLAHVTDGMTEVEVAGLLARLDRHSPDLKTADRQAKARLVASLIAGAAEPAEAQAKGRKAAAPKAPTVKKAPSSGVEAATKVLKSKAMGARKAVKAAVP